MTELWALAESNGIYVLSGQPAADTWAGTLWFSEDGFHWQSATMPAEPHIDRIHAITATSTGFAALGLDFSNDETLTHALTSAGGREWTVVGSYAGVGTYLVDVAGRLLALGNNDWESDPWYSENGGATWHRLDTQSGLDVTNGLLALHQADGFLWAVHSDNPSEDASIRTPVEVWRTSDGLEWAMVTDLPSSLAATSAALTKGPGGWVIAALRVTSDQGPLEFDYQWFSWHSPDGVTWQASESVPEYVDQILADDHGFIAMGHNHGGCCAIAEQDVRQLVWASADGSTWRRLPKAGWHGREIDFITSVGDRVTGVGIDWLVNPGPDYEGWGVGWEVARSELLP